jgi:hypothetical protein
MNQIHDFTTNHSGAVPDLYRWLYKNQAEQRSEGELK